MKKLLLAGLVVVTIALFFGMGLDEYLTLGAPKENQGRFAALLEQHPWRADRHLVWFLVRQ